MNWYIPITFLPAVALLILSTSNLLIDLNGEIDTLLQNEQNRDKNIISEKLSQLKKLTLAQFFFYGSSLLFTLASLIGALNEMHFFTVNLPISAMLIGGVTGMILGLIVLFIYSLNAVKIRQQQHQRNLRGR